MGRESHEVSLTPIEMAIAFLIGLWRHVESIVLGLKDRHGIIRTIEDDVVGAIGELAFAKFSGSYIDAVSGHITERTGTAPDIGGVQVKTAKKHTHRLIVRDNEADERVLVLVSYEKGLSVFIQGWITAKEARAIGSYEDPTGKDRPKAHFVSPSNLHREFDYLFESMSAKSSAAVIDVENDGSDFVIAIDTREQKPYEFDHPTVVTGLKTGDYSLVGFEDKVCVERKSKQDAYGTIGNGRVRFEKELSRMVWMDYAAIVIECPLKDFLVPPTYSALHPNAAINSLIAWSIRYGVHVFFCHNRRYASALTFRILEKYWRHHLRLQLEE